MYRQHIDSEAIASWDYDPKARAFTVEFTPGSIYRYYGVPPEVFKEATKAPSKGAWFNTVFKTQRYQYEEIYHPPHLSRQRFKYRDF